MAEHVDIRWPDEFTEELGEQVHALIHVVSGLGGAIGWHVPPPQSETDSWSHGLLGAVARGDAALCTAWKEGALVATGLWKRHEAHFFQHVAELAKIMAHPRARGLGLGTVVTRAVMANAAAAGIETLELGVRGNNHLAIELYERLGFREWGRLPNVIEVGDERFDDVRMFAALGRPGHLTLHGGSSAGPGSSSVRHDDHTVDTEVH